MVRIDDSDTVIKCWLSPDELDHLVQNAGADGWEREIAIQLMAWCGLRVSEVSYPSTEELRWSEDGQIWLFEIRGKNTKGGGRKTRDAWLLESLLTTSTSILENAVSLCQIRWVDTQDQLGVEVYCSTHPRPPAIGFDSGLVCRDPLWLRLRRVGNAVSYSMYPLKDCLMRALNAE